MDEKAQVKGAALFSRPWRQIVLMLVVLALVAAGVWYGARVILRIFFEHRYLNGAILAVFVLGVLSCFRQVVQLLSSVKWIEGFVAAPPGAAAEAPSLLAPLATLLRSRGARMQLSSSSARSILDSVASRIDEDREITRYLANVLIFIGLLGTFYGLATTVPGLVETIRSLNPTADESGLAVFARLQAGLETQLSGMGTAFSSSLMGLAGSLIVGLLELLVGHGQNRFYRELEEWLSSITRVGLGSEEGGSDQSLFAQVIDNLAEQMEALQLMFTQSDISRSQIDERMGDLSGAITRLAERMDDQTGTNALNRVADGQERLIALMSRDGTGEGLDAEARARLRSMDVQLLRIYEDMSAGRQEMIDALRSDIGALVRALRGGRREGAGE
ncbi:MAG: biopolymer transporter ExbB [Rubellimicrobium sp.]|nr:biopolymer transporter ExbB [Rubellimicrobium sp.]